MSPLKRTWIPSPNYSQRNSSVRLIVVHTAEGATTYQSLGNYFANPNSGVSSHTGIDDTPNIIGEYVARNNKAWTQANANPYSVATELCAFAAWTPTQWNAHPTMLSNCAQWIAEEAATYGIPIRKLNSAQAQGGTTGVCGHVDLGAAGGNHWDPGPNFPWDRVISMAQGGTPPSKVTKGRKMIDETPTGKGYFTTTHDGAVYAFGDAKYKGGANNAGSGGGTALPSGRNIISIAVCATDGYWLLSDGGDLYAFGSAQFYGKPDRV